MEHMAFGDRLKSPHANGNLQTVQFACYYCIFTFYFFIKFSILLFNTLRSIQTVTFTKKNSNFSNVYHFFLPVKLTQIRFLSDTKFDKLINYFGGTLLVN